jgi:ribosomal-protein-alanine N-acetyltransferase
MTIFETARMIVRQFTIADADFFAEMNGDEELMRYIRPVKTKAESFAFLQECIDLYEAEPGMGRWIAIEKTSMQPIGSVAVFPLKGTADIQIGYLFLKQNWGKGFAKEAVDGCLQYAKSAGHKTIVAVTEKENIASKKALLANGFLQADLHISEDGKELLLFRNPLV